MDKQSDAGGRSSAKEYYSKKTSLNKKITSSSTSLCSITTLAVAIGIALSSTSAYAINCGTVTGGTGEMACSATGTDEEAKLSLSGSNNFSYPTTPVYVISNGSGEAKLTTSGDLTVTNNGGGHGINVRGQGNDGKATAEFSGSTNITLGTGADTLVLVSSGSSSTVKITGDFNITNHSMAGIVDERDGVEVNTWGPLGGDSKLTHTCQGLISVQNGNAIHMNTSGPQGHIVVDLAGTGTGIQLSANGDNHKGISSILHTGNLDGSIDIKSNATISTNGNNAYGIYANAVGKTVTPTATGGLININNTGAINSNAAGSAGNLAHGIATLNKDHDTIIYNDGRIITQGNDASGIRAEHTIDSVTGDITVTTGSNSYIETNFANADGIHVNIGSEQTGAAVNNNGNIVVVAEGSIKTTGNGSAEGIYGASRDSSNTGNITLVFKGDTIETTGTGTNRGIYGRQDGQGNMTLAHYGQLISTQGNSAHGIYALVGTGGPATQSGDIKVYSTGQIITQGTSAYGIFASAGNKANSILIENSGSIATHGASARGIHAFSAGSSKITINNVFDSLSSITTVGDSAHAISAMINNSGAASDGILINQVGGKLTTDGYDAHGIFALTYASSGDMNIFLTDTEIDLKGGNSDGIDVQNLNSGVSDLDINVITKNSSINTLDSAYPTGGANFGIVAYQYGTAAGDINVINENTNITTGISAAGTAPNSSAIAVRFHNATATGNIYVNNSGELSTQGRTAYGIDAVNLGSGTVTILNSNTITTAGESSDGIKTQSESGNIKIGNTGNIITRDGKGIHAKSTTGNIDVRANGNITTGQNTATIHNHGIDASTKDGNVDVYYDNGTIEVVGNANGGGNTIGIASWDNNSTNASVNATINLGSNAIVDASKGVGGLQIRSNGTGIIDIAQGAKVIGGANNASAAKGYGIEFRADTSAGPARFELHNAGSVSALSDLAIKGSGVTGTTLTINNYGTIDGYLTLGAEDTTFSNWSSNSWNIRNFADTDGDGIRDAKEIAVSDFGAGYDVFKNEATGTVRLLAVSGETNIPVAAGYIPDGALDITNAGTVHGHLLNLDRFENRGTIDLSDNGQAGDVLLITGGATAGANGGGKFVADGGFLILDTVLNDGDLNSLSDVLVVDDIEAGSDVTRITINRVGGMGAITIGDGIKVVDVLGTADAGSFALDGVVKGGIYEYTLHEGSVTTPGNNSLFLRTSAQQLNPDIGSYLANQTAATGLFMHSLHDRLGEPQLYQNYREEDKSIPAVWLRAVAGHTKNEAGGGLLNQHSESTLLHLGGEVADWSSNGDDRFHLGLMGAWGRVETKTTSQATDSRVKGTVDGYGVGAYLTWYDNPANVEGWYSDVWTMYNWFNNETEGSAKYDSESWTTSLEVGYAMKLSALENYDWMLEPQGQVAYNYYSVDSIQDRNGMKVTDSDANGFATRLGMRTYLRPSTFRNGAQPFFEVNWLYNSANNSMMFNDARIADDTPENRFEAKVGVQGEMTKHLQVYSHIGLQWGQNSYEHAEGQVGVRYRF
jgi:autotransporter family porin